MGKPDEKKAVHCYAQDYEALAKRKVHPKSFADLIHEALVAAGWVKDKKKGKK